MGSTRHWTCAILLGAGLLSLAAPVAAARSADFAQLIRDGERLMEAGKLDEARAPLEAAWEIGSRHKVSSARYGASVRALKRLYRLRRDWTGSTPFLERVLADQERAYGPGHHEVATTLNDLGIAWFWLAQYDKAEGAYTRALTIRRALFGPSHPSVADLVTNLGECYRKQELFEEAERLFLQALADKEAAFGAEHESLISTLNDLALVYTRLRRYADAERMLLRAQSLATEHRGVTSSDLAIILHNLGTAAYRQSKHGVARDYYVKAIAIREGHAERGASDLARSVNALANVELAAGHADRSLAIYRRAIALYESAEPVAKAPLVKTLGDYRLALRQAGRKAEAEKVAARVEALRAP